MNIRNIIKNGEEWDHKHGKPHLTGTRPVENLSKPRGKKHHVTKHHMVILLLHCSRQHYWLCCLDKYLWKIEISP